MKMRHPTEIFEEWAENGKDIGMEKSHAISVDQMISFAMEERTDIGKNFSFLDLGCGSGWVARKVAKEDLCSRAVGIDGAAQMIVNAKSRGGNEEYIHADINYFSPVSKYDLIHSMEVLYYLEDPSNIIKRISESWLNKDGRLIAGIDLYYENTDSHSWQEKVGTPMHMLKESQWVEIFKLAGLREVKAWRINKHEGWEGTLVLTGIK